MLREKGVCGRVFCFKFNKLFLDKIMTQPRELLIFHYYRLPQSPKTKTPSRSVSDSEAPTRNCLLYWHFTNMDISHKRVRVIIGCFYKNQKAMHALPVDCIIQDCIGSSPTISSPSVIPIPIPIPIPSRSSSG